MGRSSWPNRDPIEEEGGATLYAFLRNAPLGAPDAFGLFQVDESTFRITVEPNEIVILYGHQHTPPWKFIFKHRVCSAGGAIVCYPVRTNDEIPLANKIHSDLPRHNNLMFFYGTLNSKGQQAARRELRDADTDGDRMLVQLTEWAKAKAKWYGVNKICGCDKVYIRYYRDTRKISLPGGITLDWLQDVNFPTKPRDLVYDVKAQQFKEDAK